MAGRPFIVLEKQHNSNYSRSRKTNVGKVTREGEVMIQGESEGWRFYAIPRAGVIFTMKTSFDVFSLS